MKIFGSLVLIIFSLTTLAETKFSVDVSIDKLTFQKPVKGVGKAGILNFKTANITNNGIVLNVDNVNKYFDSQIFVRPTFLGFTTQFGNYGFALEDGSVLNQINQTELQNAKLILDDSQLNLSGQFFSMINVDTSLKLKNFLLYCQGAGFAVNETNKLVETPSADIIKNCFSFMTLNGSYLPLNPIAEIEYEGFKNNSKTFMQSQVRSFDLRKNLINADLVSAKIVTNDEFVINAKNVKLDCDKDEDLTELDFEKIKKACSNRFRLSPLQASLVDKKKKTSFVLDINSIVVKNKILYFGMNSGTLSGVESTTYLTNILLNCRKEPESDLFELNHVLRDCLTYGRLSIGLMRSDNKIDDKKDSSNKNLVINLDASKLVLQTVIHFLGFDHRISIYGNMALDEDKKKLVLTVTDTRLPFGITSVKLLMYFLKKDLISKDISIQNNVITISL
jgi:hypothetical protein